MFYFSHNKELGGLVHLMLPAGHTVDPGRLYYDHSEEVHHETLNPTMDPPSPVLALGFSLHHPVQALAQLIGTSSKEART